MKKSLVLVLLSCLLAVLAATAAVFSPPPASVPAAKVAALTAADLISQGKSALQQHQPGSILTARGLFAQAVSLDPNNQEANLLYGVTRIFAIFEQPGTSAGVDSVKEIFEASGFSFQSFGLYDTQTSSEPDGLAPTTPRTGAVLDYVKLKVLPEIDGALANLAKVTSPTFSSTLAPAAIATSYGENISVDYADALVIKALLNAVKCNLRLLMVYGLDVSLPDIAAAPDQLLTYKKLFADDATLLRVKDAESLGIARSALLGFIDTYNLALARVQARGTAGHHLFVVDVTVSNEPVSADSQDLVELAGALADIKAALNGPKLLSFVQTDLDRDRTVDLSKFFSTTAPIDIRARLGNCSNGTISGDATIGGVFPQGLSGYQNAVQEVGNDLLGVVCTGWEQPKIEVNPDYLWLNENQWYSTGPYAVTIRNYGTGTLHTSSISLGGANSGDFVLTAGSCGTLAPVLAAGSSCAVTVDVKRPVVSSGYKMATLQVVSDDSSHPFSSAQVNGSLSPTTAGIISGIVTDFGDGDGEGGQVTLYDAQTGALLGWESTNHTGGYAFVGLAAGSYKLYFTPYDGSAQSRWYNGESVLQSADTVQLAAGQQLSGIDFNLLPNAQLLTVQTSGSGTGTVNSSPAGIACLSGSSINCSASYPTGSQVTLIPSVSSGSAFAGWSGACSGTGSCLVTMNGARSVTAGFTLHPATVGIDGSAVSYHNIGVALDAISAVGTVRAKDQTFTENVILNNPAAIRFRGGFTDSAFSLRSSTSFTTLDGVLKIRRGTLKTERFRVR